MPCHRSSVGERVYRFRRQAEYEELCLTLPNEITGIVRQHMVLAPGRAPGRPDYVEVMTVRPFLFRLTLSGTYLSNAALGHDPRSMWPKSPNLSNPQKTLSVTAQIHESVTRVCSGGKIDAIHNSTGAIVSEAGRVL